MKNLKSKRINLFTDEELKEMKEAEKNMLIVKGLSVFLMFLGGVMGFVIGLTMCGKL